jgi:demethylmenaquinone methyltransferase/2-methoxy-6-polyprenyl-1,4-benzoquinol methylase
MKAPAEKQDLGLMRAMFGEIAPRYDFITRMFSFGMDARWKRLGVARADLADDAIVLDLASGTGDFSELILRQLPRARAVAVDLTEAMLRRARERGLTETACADATALPFADGAFDCVFVGYGLRNFPCLQSALREIVRVTHPGGTMVALDFFLPRNAVLRRVYLGYLYAQGAFWGLLLHGRARTYTYIPDSLRSFVSLEEFSAMVGRMGYERVDARSFIFGGIGLCWAVKRQAALGMAED